MAGVAPRLLAGGAVDRAPFRLGLPSIAEGRIRRLGRDVRLHVKVLKGPDGARHFDQAFRLFAPDARRRSHQARLIDLDFVGLRREGDALLPQIIAAVLGLAVDRHGHRRRVLRLVGINARIGKGSLINDVSLVLPPEADKGITHRGALGCGDADFLTRLGLGGRRTQADLGLHHFDLELVRFGNGREHGARLLQHVHPHFHFPHLGEPARRRVFCIFEGGEGHLGIRLPPVDKARRRGGAVRRRNLGPER